MRQLSINNSKIIKLLKENKKVVGDFNKSKASKISKEYIEKYKSLEKELQEI